MVAAVTRADGSVAIIDTPTSDCSLRTDKDRPAHPDRPTASLLRFIRSSESVDASAIITALGAITVP